MRAFEPAAHRKPQEFSSEEDSLLRDRQERAGRLPERALFHPGLRGGGSGGRGRRAAAAGQAGQRCAHHQPGEQHLHRSDPPGSLGHSPGMLLGADGGPLPPGRVPAHGEPHRQGEVPGRFHPHQDHVQPEHHGAPAAPGRQDHRAPGRGHARHAGVHRADRQGGVHR